MWDAINPIMNVAMIIIYDMEELPVYWAISPLANRYGHDHGK